MTTTKLRDNNLALAAALALVAAVLTMIYVTQSGGGSATAATGGQSTAKVYVATRDIPVGTAGIDLVHDRYVAVRQVASGAVAPGAITDRRQVTGLVAVQPVYAGEQLTERRFGESGATGLLSDLRGIGRVIQIAGDAQQLLAGTLKAGDHVDVVASMRGAGDSALGRIVLRNLLVVNVASTKGTTGSSSSVTLQVTDRQARTLFFVVKNGDWSLVLRPLVRPQNSADGVVSAATVLEGRN